MARPGDLSRDGTAPIYLCKCSQNIIACTNLCFGLTIRTLFPYQAATQRYIKVYWVEKVLHFFFIEEKGMKGFKNVPGRNALRKFGNYYFEGI